jgi:predicted MPP superfamily phosphohydrolase
MSVFFLTLMLVFFGGDFLWWWRSRRRISAQPWRGLATAFALLQVIGLSVVMFGRISGDHWDSVLPRPLVAAVYLWHLLILIPWLLVVAVGELIKGAVALTRRISQRRREPAQTDGMSRREFLTTTMTFTPAILAAGGAVLSEPQLEEFRIRRLELPMPILPLQLDGLTIAHLSDVHIGRFTHDKVLARISDTINAMKADLVVMTGDLIDFSLHDLPTGIELMKSLRGAHGTYLCEGNHDLFEGAEEFRRTVLKSGLALLRDDQVTLPINGARLQLLGLPWVHGDEGHRALMKRLRLQRDANAFPIVLAHHPHAFDFAQGFPMMLSGHTHGGQLNLTSEIGFGPLFFRYWSGLYQKEGRTLFVSNGVGNWFPLRINTPAEVTHITLRRMG